MKFSEKWLREWVNPDLTTEGLAHELTMAGHEVDGVEVQGVGLDGVVVGEVLQVEPHPDADRLSVCLVSVGEGDPVQVVCGAPNVRSGMRSPFAAPGTKLPNGLKLRKSKIRGVVSNGMLCSAEELGLGEDSDGIIELPADAAAGLSLTDYLQLPDAVIDVDLTPNRGDCFSVLGIARDLAAMTGSRFNEPEVIPARPTVDDLQPVVLEDASACPRFAGRVVKGIDPSARSPAWMVERLRRSGIRSIHPVVDVTNYVMMELGQPLHAYDLAKLRGAIRPRFAKAGEKVVLLDEREIQLAPDTVIITDDSGPIGMAGIMGGLSTAVTDLTTDVFFEAAFWPQQVMAGRARSYGLHTDASMRFERGVDPDQQARAIERATGLLLEISGGKAGPLIDEQHPENLPRRQPVRLRHARLAKVLGCDFDTDTVTRILRGLGLKTDEKESGWDVTAPGFRFDIEIEEDLIEEVARVFGYDNIPEKTAIAETPLAAVTETRTGLDSVADTLVARDYQEAITYSFIDAETDELLTGSPSAMVLANPISSEMSVMRGTLWAGLVKSAAANLARQQERVRLFEIGKSFHGTPGKPVEVMRVAGLVTGSRAPEQWGTRSQSVDFFDIKSDVERLFEMTGEPDRFAFVAADHVTLQPGQTAEILRAGKRAGWVGKLHPAITAATGIRKDVFVFELDADECFAARIPAAVTISRFPAIRRDIAVVVDEGVSARQLVTAVREAVPDLIRSVIIFDVYQGPGIEAGLKSVALGLILQETSRTLTDEDADSAMDAATKKLHQEFAAVLRD